MDLEYKFSIQNILSFKSIHFIVDLPRGQFASLSIIYNKFKTITYYLGARENMLKRVTV
jgi:hypothetical protein